MPLLCRTPRYNTELIASLSGAPSLGSSSELSPALTCILVILYPSYHLNRLSSVRLRGGLTYSAQPPQCLTSSARCMRRVWSWIEFTCPKCQVQRCSLAKQEFIVSGNRWEHRCLIHIIGFIFPNRQVPNSNHPTPKLMPSSCYSPTVSLLWFLSFFVFSLGSFSGSNHPSSALHPLLPPAQVHKPGMYSKIKMAFKM